MIDIKSIRDDKDSYIKAIEDKKIKLETSTQSSENPVSAKQFIEHLLNLDKERRSLSHQIDQLRFKQNAISQNIIQANKIEKKDLIKDANEIKNEIMKIEPTLNKVTDEFRALILRVPSIPDSEVPIGLSDDDNVEVKRWGQIPTFNFPFQDHVQLGEKLDIIDIPRGVKLSGSRSYFLKNEGALLELAVTKFALDFLITSGFIPFLVPLLVNDNAMIGTGFFPGGEEQSYRIEKDQLNLIGTAEVSVTSYHSDEILTENELPKYYVGLSNCFRREAGTYGKDTKGIYRIHQFQKVEQVVICKNDNLTSRKMHHFILSNSEKILQALKLPYRIVKVCSAELGQGQVLKHDIETWMPSRNSYSETHSCSTLHDFQARRLNIKYRDQAGNIKFAHTLNNTAIASPRILIPILEMNQLADGSVMIPDVLKPYMGNMQVIKPK